MLRRICEWNNERQLKVFNKDTELMMLIEEINELRGAATDEEAIDALCDIIVVAVGSIHKLGYDPEVAMDETIKEITSRTGEVKSDGKWYKYTDDNARAKWYKARYAGSRYGSAE